MVDSNIGDSPKLIVFHWCLIGFAKVAGAGPYGWWYFVLIHGKTVASSWF